MAHVHEFDPVYSELLFRIDDAHLTEEQVGEEAGLAADDFREHLAELEDLGLVVRRGDVLEIDWRAMKQAYVHWLDDVVDERIFFAEQVRDPELREYYAPLARWTDGLREEVVSSEGLERIFRNGFSNFRFMLDYYHTDGVSLHQFFNEFTVSFSDYDKFLDLVDEDEALRALSEICDRAIVNPFAFFAFHTEYFPAEGV